MKAVGITCGIGSMLVGARQAGFDVAGNVEWRKYYHGKDEEGRNTFRENFPGADFDQSLDHLTNSEIEKLFGADIALGHPECGNFSTMTSTAQQSRKLAEINSDPGDIPLFTEIVGKLKPRFFVMDDLPKSFIAYPMEKYHEALPDYDLFPEWVSNWGYGNVQKHRNRFFMLGALKEERWAFRPGEFEHSRTVADVLDLLPVDPPARGNMPNHEPHNGYGRSGCPRHPDDFAASGIKYLTWEELREWFAAKPEGYTFEYIRRGDYELKKKVGLRKAYWEGVCPVLHGGRPIIHPLRNMPFTIRERARIQGFPDEFIFYGTKLDEDGAWDHEKNNHMVKQTGKAMPVQFCRFVSDQIAAHIRGEDFECSDQRVIKPNEWVDNAKFWFCENVGYADQERACASCWLYDRCEIRARKYRIGEPQVGQRDAFDPGVVPVKDEPSPEAPKPKPLKVDRFVPPEGRSKIRGTRPGVGKRMMELIREGKPVDTILRTVHKEFPGTAANATDVAKVRARMD